MCPSRVTASTVEARSSARRRDGGKAPVRSASHPARANAGAQTTSMANTSKSSAPPSSAVRNISRATSEALGSVWVRTTTSGFSRWNRSSEAWKAAGSPRSGWCSRTMVTGPGGCASRSPREQARAVRNTAETRYRRRAGRIPPSVGRKVGPLQAGGASWNAGLVSMLSTVHRTRMSEAPATVLFMHAVAATPDAYLAALSNAAGLLDWPLPRERDEATCHEAARALDALFVRVARGRGALDLAVGEGLEVMATG